MPSLFEAFWAHPMYLHRDFNSLQELPDSCPWTQLGDHHAYPSNSCSCRPKCFKDHRSYMQNMGGLASRYSPFPFTKTLKQLAPRFDYGALASPSSSPSSCGLTASQFWIPLLSFSSNSIPKTILNIGTK
ncbi:Gibberellin 3-beta-dioxygenase 1 [Spatholobus suberectus]|nr:Gibberellin 3-beta-dioxygenase 1 [Spatholobus suberectus]